METQAQQLFILGRFRNRKNWIALTINLFMVFLPTPYLADIGR